MKDDGTPDITRDMPWSRYTLPNGVKVYLTSRPDRYISRDNTYTRLFGHLTGQKPTIRLYFTDDAIPGFLGEKAFWVPWFMDSDKREDDNPTLSSIATATSILKTYDAGKSVLWLHCDSSSCRAPTYFGLYLHAYYPKEIDSILLTRETNMKPDYIWSCPKEYAQIDLDRDPRVEVLLNQIKERM